MTTILKIIRTKNATSKNFIFLDTEIKTSNPTGTSLKAEINYPKDEADDSTESFVINLGVDQYISFEFKLYTETTDRAEGTHTATVESFGEALNYLEDIILYPGIGEVEYEITVTDKFRTRTYICSYEDHSINTDAGLYPTGNMKFKIKRVSS